MTSATGLVIVRSARAMLASVAIMMVLGLSSSAVAEGMVSSASAAVTMTCRPLNYLLKHAALRHCGVIVWHWCEECTPKKIIDVQFSTPGWSTRPTGRTDNPTYIQDRAAFYNPGGRKTNYDIAVPPGMTAAEFADAVIRSGQGVYFRFYSPVGPNSNTVAAAIISRAGGTPPAVPYALGEKVPRSSGARAQSFLP